MKDLRFLLNCLRHSLWELKVAHKHTVRSSEVGHAASSHLTSSSRRRVVPGVSDDGRAIAWVLAACRCTSKTRRMKRKRRMRTTPSPRIKHRLVLDQADETESLSEESWENSCGASRPHPSAFHVNTPITRPRYTSVRSCTPPHWFNVIFISSTFSNKALER